MSLKSTISGELDRIAQSGVSVGNSATMVIAIPEGRFECDLEMVDSIGVAFRTFRFLTSHLSSTNATELKRLSELLSSRLTYLLEPIRPVEFDTDQCVVQLRSNPPQYDDDGRSYYELIARPGELFLCRYNKAPGETRKLIAANVTREVFCRLANDFASVV